MRALIVVLLIVLALLQLKLWFGTGGRADVTQLQESLSELEEEVESLRKRNAQLEAEVIDLKTGREAVEERARSELGMVEEGEVFYQVAEPAEPREDDPLRPDP